LLVYFNSKLTK